MTSEEPTTPMDRADEPGSAGPLGGSGGPALPGLAEGTELAGEFVGAGYKEPPLLVYRGDGQVVRLPELLYQTVRALDECHRLGDPAAGRRPFTSRMRLLAAVAEHLSAQADREYAAEHVEFLLDQKLAPLGVTTYSDGTPPELVKPQPMLSLTCRMTMLSERSTWFLAGLFTWLFSPPVLAATIPLILGAASWTLITQPIAAAVEVTIGSPASILLVVALAIASTAFHEIGHGTACRYGGVRPGVTGCGLYLAWPVFFTDITNTYRMGRGGRLRADFGGVYFNGVFLFLLTVGYMASGRSPVLLVAILSTSLEAVQQLLPTLRFDGYYIVADFVGIPDLFKYIGPIIRRVLLRRPDDGRLAALKRWPQTVVTVWVLLVVPVLLGQLSLLVYNFPGIVRSDWTGVRVLAANSMAGGNPVLGVASAVVQILLLLFPLAGMTLIAFRLLRGLIRMIAKRLHKAGLVDLTALAGVWGISWFLGLQGTRPATEATTVGVDSLLDSGSASDAAAADAEPDRKRGLWLVDDDDLPAPRHRKPRAGMLPVLGAAAALAVVVILAWILMPSSSHEGKVADLRPNQAIGAPTGRPTPPGRTPSAPPSSASEPGPEPSSGNPGPAYSGSRYPGEGEGDGYASSSVSHGSGSYSPGSGSYGPGSGEGGSGPGHGSAGTGGGGAGMNSAGAGQPSSGGASRQTPSAASSTPGTFSGQPSSYPPSSAGQSSNGRAPAASAGPASAPPSGGQSSSSQPASQPASGQPSSAQPSQSGGGASPSAGQPSAAPSSSAQWQPEAPGPSQSSPSGSSPPSPPSSSSSPSGSGSPQPSASGGSASPSAQPGTPQAACQVPVGGILLTLIGLCGH